MLVYMDNIVTDTSIIRMTGRWILLPAWLEISITMTQWCRGLSTQNIMPQIMSAHRSDVLDLESIHPGGPLYRWQINSLLTIVLAERGEQSASAYSVSLSIG